jgi:hypothetical protein
MGPYGARQILLFKRFAASIGLVLLFAGRAAAGQIGYVYALLQQDGLINQIYGFRFDQSTGALTLCARNTGWDRSHTPTRHSPSP